MKSVLVGVCMTVGLLSDAHAQYRGDYDRYYQNDSFPRWQREYRDSSRSFRGERLQMNESRYYRDRAYERQRDPVTKLRRGDYYYDR